MPASRPSCSKSCNAVKSRPPRFDGGPRAQIAKSGRRARPCADGHDRLSATRPRCLSTLPTVTPPTRATDGRRFPCAQRLRATDTRLRGARAFNRTTSPTMRRRLTTCARWESLGSHRPSAPGPLRARVLGFGCAPRPAARRPLSLSPCVAPLCAAAPDPCALDPSPGTRSPSPHVARTLRARALACRCAPRQNPGRPPIAPL